MGQSNFEHTAGYAWEYGFYYHQGKNPNPPESPLVPEKGTVYSFYSVNTTLDQFAQEDFVLDDSADMIIAYLSGFVNALKEMYYQYGKKVSAMSWADSYEDFERARDALLEK